MIDWSYQLLAVPERVVLERMSVFGRASFDLAAAEAICACDYVPQDDVLDHLDALVDKTCFRSRIPWLNPAIACLSNDLGVRRRTVQRSRRSSDSRGPAGAPRSLPRARRSLGAPAPGTRPSPVARPTIA